MAEDNPQISVSFLRTYDALKDKKDEQLQKIVDRLANEMITEKVAPQVPVLSCKRTLKVWIPEPG